MVVRTAPDPRFERRGRDLFSVHTIEAADAALGVNIKAPTLAGAAVLVKAPPGTQPDTIFRLRGKGLPSFGGGNPGDLHVRLRVHVPECLSPKQRELFERLRALDGKKSKRPGGASAE